MKFIRVYDCWESNEVIVNADFIVRISPCSAHGSQCMIQLSTTKNAILAEQSMDEIMSMIGGAE